MKKILFAIIFGFICQTTAWADDIALTSDSPRSFSEDAGSVELSFERQGNPVGRKTVIVRAGPPVASGVQRATANLDYEFIERTLTWEDGETQRQSFSIQIIEDSLTEEDEIFSVRVTEPDAAGYSAWDLRILDNDIAPATLELEQDIVRVQEDVGTGYVVVNRAGDTSAGASVEYICIDVTARSGATPSEGDYFPCVGRLRWDAGAVAPLHIPIDIHNNNLINQDRRFIVRLFNPIGAELPVADANVFITEDDAGIELVPHLVMLEGANHNFVVRRVGNLTKTIAVGYDILGGSAILGQDFTIDPPSKLEWNDANPKLIRVQTIQDTLQEGNETFTIALRNPTSAIIVGENPQTVIIQDDEPPLSQHGTIVFSGGNQQDGSISIQEQDVTLLVSLKRVGGKDGRVSVVYRAVIDDLSRDGQATPAQGAPIVWDDGDDSERTIALQLIDDNIYQGTEHLVLEIQEPTGGVQIGNNSRKTIFVTDDETGLPGRIEFIAGPIHINEESIVDVTVRRVGGSDGPASVIVQTENGTADESDYVPINSFKLEWANGDDTPRILKISAHADQQLEEDETFKVKFLDVQGAELPTTEFSVVIFSLESPTMRVDSQTIPFGETAQLEVEYGPKPPFFDQFIYGWMLVSGPGDIAFNTNDRRASATFTAPGVYQLKVIVELPGRWVSEVPFTVTVLPPVVQQAAAPTQNLADYSKGQQITFTGQMNRGGHLQIDIYDRAGRDVITLVNEARAAGNYSLPWNGADSSGSPVAPGTYRAVINEDGSRRKLTLILIR